MITVKSVTARNFLSVGNVTQSVNLNRNDLTLILGENLDLGGDDAGARNGTGKSALLNIVSYALSISNHTHVSCSHIASSFLFGVAVGWRRLPFC